MSVVADRARHDVADPGEATTHLFETHSHMVVALCRLLLRDGDEAQDASQQTFLSAHKALLAGTRPRQPRAWLAAIARNECRKRIRSRTRTTSIGALDEVDGGCGDATVDAVERNADMAELRAALRDLPPRQREALLLREVYGLRGAEVAAAMDVAHPTVDVLLWKARRRLGARVRGLPALGGGLLVPPWLREQLARTAPGAGAGEAAAAVAAVPVAAKIAAVTAGTVVATTAVVWPAQRVAPPPPAAAAASELARSGVPHPDAVPVPAASGRGGSADPGAGRSGRRGGDRVRRDSGGKGGDGAQAERRSGSSGRGSRSGGPDASGARSGSSGSGGPRSGSGGSSGSGRSGGSGESGGSGAGGVVTTATSVASAAAQTSGSGSSGSGSSSSGSGFSGSTSSGSSGSGSSASASSGSSGSDSSGSGSSGSGSSAATASGSNAGSDEPVAAAATAPADSGSSGSGSSSSGSSSSGSSSSGSTGSGSSSSGSSSGSSGSESD